MNLYIVRHAWAGERDGRRWPDDDARPLTDEGRQRFARVVKVLIDRGVAPDLIVTSPLARCVETAQLLAAGMGKVKVIEHDELRPGGAIGGLFHGTVSQTPQHASIAWVGHAPDVNRFAAALVGDRSARIHFAKGAVAAIEFDDPPILGQGELQWLATAKMLGC